MKVQLKYQKELEKLERDNKELRKQLLLRGASTTANRKIKVKVPPFYNIKSNDGSAFIRRNP